jgi:hypothetical protein
MVNGEWKKPPSKAETNIKQAGKSQMVNGEWKKPHPEIGEAPSPGTIYHSPFIIYLAWGL